jgi:replicative DNA helicase
LLGGFQKSDLCIVAARPGVGKTSFLLGVALNAARAGARVAIFSLEMSHEQLIQRLYAVESGINSTRLRTGKLEPHEWDLFVEVTGRLDHLSIFIDDSPGIAVQQMRARCRRLYRENGLDMIIVDYLQLMSAGQTRIENRVQEISTISRGLKELARELNVPVIAAAQLSRAVEQRSDKRPILSDLRESGSIEQDSDIVMFLYRDELYNENTERPNQADVIVAKHRNGPTGIVSLYFRKELTQFVDMVKSNVNLSDY